MNASRAKRRWITWCRYIDKTQTATDSKWYAGMHRGHTKAYDDLMYARRAFPRGVRLPYYPRWGTVR